MKFLVTGSAGLVGKQVTKDSSLDVSNALSMLDEKPQEINHSLDCFIQEIPKFS